MTMPESRNQKRSALWRLARYARHAGLPLTLGFLLTVLTVGLDLLGPYIISRILDKEILAGLGVRDSRVFLTMIALYSASLLLSLASRYGGSVFNQTAANRIARVMQGEIFAHVQKLPVAYFDSLAAGSVVSRVTNDTKAVRIFFTTVLSRLLMAGVFALGILLGLLSLDWRLFLIASISFPVLFFLFRDFQKKSLHYSRRYRKGISQLNAAMNENIHGIEVIQAYNRERDMYDTYNRINRQVFQNGLGMTRLHAYSGWNATDALNYSMFALALLYFGVSNIRGSQLVTIGQLYLFIDYMIRFFAQMNQAMQHLGNLERARGAADHIFQLLDQPTVSDQGEEVPDLKGEVAFEGVSFAYKEEDYVLKDVNFRIPEATTAAFVGQTGSGKSTIMNLLLAFYDLNKGRILIDGRDLKDLDRQSVRRHMAIVTQEPFLFTGTIESNITLNRPGLGPDEARSALIEVGGGAFLARLADGVRTEVRERGHEFSAGERQLISFARALAQDPTVLILDEATSHIDSETEDIIQKGIERLSRGRTTLIIAHRLSTIRHAQKIYVLDQGRIVEEGSHSQLLEKQGIFANMVAMQTRQRRQEGDR